jgi:LPXTG-site transpeptidase (sortase) family protein
VKKILYKSIKVILSIFILLIIVGYFFGLYYIYKYLEDMNVQNNLNNVYNIYNSDNRQDIINQFNTDGSVGVPIDDTTNAIATLEIPSINLKNIVVEGTSQNSLSKGIGLFEHSNILDGNVCLAGHNSKNIFANLKNIKGGDTIKYSSCLGNKEYNVETIKQINENDWSMLEETNDNRITLITCVKNHPNLRLCVQGIEKK